MTKKIEQSQKKICEKYNFTYHKVDYGLKLGISSLDSKSIKYPINGLRHNSEGRTNGWYIWFGEYSDATDFFLPVHTEHLYLYFPDLLKFLGLPPGSRFLVGENNYQDVWYDPSLIL